MRKPLLAILVLILAAAIPSAAQPPNNKSATQPPSDPQSAFEPRGAPGPGQKFLQQFVGEWTVAKTFYPRTGDPVRAEGVCRQTMIHDGRFLQSDFTFGDGAAKTTGLGLIGFDSSSGKFTSVWTDSRQTRMSFRQGRDKFDGERIVLYSTALGADAESRQSKTVTELTDHGAKIVHRQYNLTANGQERLVMELAMTRKPKDQSK
jgi:Protein of unknown function (DUF1579)